MKRRGCKAYFGQNIRVGALGFQGAEEERDYDCDYDREVRGAGLPFLIVSACIHWFRHASRRCVLLKHSWPCADDRGEPGTLCASRFHASETSLDSLRSCADAVCRVGV